MLHQRVNIEVKSCIMEKVQNLLCFDFARVLEKTPLLRQRLGLLFYQTSENFLRDLDTVELMCYSDRNIQAPAPHDPEKRVKQTNKKVYLVTYS